MSASAYLGAIRREIGFSSLHASVPLVTGGQEWVSIREVNVEFFILTHSLHAKERIS